MNNENLELIYTSENTVLASGDLKKKVFSITLTDMQGHSAKPVNPTPIYRKIEKATRAKKPDRFYSESINVIKGDNKTIAIESIFLLEPRIKDLRDRTVMEGKVFQILAPKDGIDFLLGKDMIEKIKSNPRLQKMFKGIDLESASIKMKLNFKN